MSCLLPDITMRATTEGSYLIFGKKQKQPRFDSGWFLFVYLFAGYDIANMLKFLYCNDLTRGYILISFCRPIHSLTLPTNPSSSWYIDIQWNSQRSPSDAFPLPHHLQNHSQWIFNVEGGVFIYILSTINAIWNHKTVETMILCSCSAPSKLMIVKLVTRLEYRGPNWSYILSADSSSFRLHVDFWSGRIYPLN